MMMNLFSTFDPSTNFNMQLNWLSTFIGLIFIPQLFWLIPSRFYFLWNKILSTLHLEFKILLGNPKMNGSTLIFVSLFSIVLYNNFMGLFPYIFTSTSHLTLTLTLALPLWISFMIFGYINNTIHMLAHTVPQGTPPVLMPFMVCIETISNIIRPGTLAMRLAANMVAGHLLITFLSGTGSSLSLFLINFLILVQLALFTLEFAVSIIQSYVFAVLTALYSSEVN
uniref:ATP synthase subunit a n=1 Tax=Coomaniella copipes TaxID=2936727 RepID=A0A8T9VY21_9COLE|nr:ATP synthase F0 subunit 6 [Coomaniella copipes]UPI13475.1 ATP synthase F0 subunit 6 [Coomaniella copipes]